jgi:hypothetical protein
LKEQAVNDIRDVLIWRIFIKECCNGAVDLGDGVCNIGGWVVKDVTDDIQKYTK